MFRKKSMIMWVVAAVAVLLVAGFVWRSVHDAKRLNEQEISLILKLIGLPEGTDVRGAGAILMSGRPTMLFVRLRLGTEDMDGLVGGSWMAHHKVTETEDQGFRRWPRGYIYGIQWLNTSMLLEGDIYVREIDVFSETPGPMILRVAVTRSPGNQIELYGAVRYKSREKMLLRPVDIDVLDLMIKKDRIRAGGMQSYTICAAEQGL